MNRLLQITRWLYAGFFLLIGLQSLLVYAGILPRGGYPGSPEMKEFSRAVFSAGFIGPLMTATYICSGVLMLFSRTAPLGLVLLAPFVVAILFAHLMLNGIPALGIAIALLWAVLAWQFRKAYEPMWTYRA
ncbi:MAG: hypothetical protein PVI37_02765 [Gammaproteobacteria bacterium]|jgi:hypothetical protein